MLGEARVLSTDIWCAFSLQLDEKLLIFRIGLHASISIHICDDYLDQATGKWVRSPLTLTMRFVDPVDAVSKSRMLHYSNRSTPRTIAKRLLHLRPSPPSVVKVWSTTSRRIGSDVERSFGWNENEARGIGQDRSRLSEYI